MPLSIYTQTAVINFSYINFLFSFSELIKVLKPPYVRGFSLKLFYGGN